MKMYIHYNIFFLDYPQLKFDVPAEIEFASEAFDAKPDAINIWIGGSKSISSLHRDPYENIYTVIRGKKIFKLYPPTTRGRIIYKGKEFSFYKNVFFK
jgi:jumonji domain-containing protein 7